MKRKLVKTTFDVLTIDSIFMKLICGRRYNMYMEYMHYHRFNNDKHCGVIRIVYGGALRVVVVHHDGFFYDRYNSPCAILLSDII